jgi:hypothetical protein
MEFFVPCVVALTSVLAYFFFIRNRASVSLSTAAKKLFEFVGMFVVFLLLNGVVIGILALSARTLGLGFISLYFIGDEMLFVFSAIQALLFCFWLGD